MTSIVDLFQGHLAGLEECVALVDDLRRLGAARTRLGRLSSATQTRVRAGRAWETISLDGCVLYLAAQFELAARDLAEDLATRMAARVSRYADLPEKVRSQNIRVVGELLGGLGRQRFGHIDHVAVVQDLARSLSAGRPVRLYVGGFATHDRNLTSEQLADLYGRADVAHFWQKVASGADIRLHFGTASSETTASLARAKLDDFMGVRNEIAHRGPNYQTVGPSVVLDYVQFFRVLVPAVASVLDAHVDSLRPKRGATAQS